MVNVLDLINSCRRIQGLEIRPVTMTPFIASRLLEANTKNRKISESVVQRYANEINNDEWLLSSQGIGFDDNGILIDGQHRLAAVVLANKEVPMLIVYGLAPKSQEKVDRQRKRSLFEALYLSGAADSKKSVQIASFLSILNTKGSFSNLNAIPDSEIKKTLECHKEAILGILSCSGVTEKGIGRVGFLAGCVLFYEIDKDRAVEFVKKVKDGEMMTCDHPAMRLRRFLMGEGGYIRMGSASKNCQRIDFRKTIFAINAFYENRKISALKDSDNFSFENK